LQVRDNRTLALRVEGAESLAHTLGLAGEQVIP